MTKSYAILVFLTICCSQMCESVTDMSNKYIKCYQCTDDVTRECELSRSSEVLCTRDTSVCLLKRRKSARSDSNLAIRKCVIPPVAPCENGFDCIQCDEDSCNDVIKPKIECYQCPLNIKGLCTIHEATSNGLTCLGDEIDSCLVQYPADGSSENAMRRCINKSYKCPPGQICSFCTKDLCNTATSITYGLLTLIISLPLLTFIY